MGFPPRCGALKWLGEGAESGSSGFGPRRGALAPMTAAAAHPGPVLFDEVMPVTGCGVTHHAATSEPDSPADRLRALPLVLAVLVLPAVEPPKALAESAKPVAK